MNPPDESPKLRMAPTDAPEPPELLERRVARERLALERQQEVELDRSLTPFRVGSVDALNAVPLTRGVEDEVTYAPPSKLAELLRRNELDAALVSVVEVLFTERYDILDGIAIASLGEVKSVFLAHTQPLEEIREVFLDPASLTSVNLLKVLLAERGVKPEFKPLPSYQEAPKLAAVLLIGDRALDFAFANHPHTILDLGAAWYELTGLPFVYAVWALRRGVENKALRRALREARDFGLDTLDHIISSRKEYSYEFRKDYLGWHIHFHLGTDEKRGIAKFMELLRKHGLGPVHEPKFVS
jgi:chorismate dehydratase